jgi:hypothetical protein
MTRIRGTRPLERRTIVVTRAAPQAQRFVQLLEEAGARVLQAPTIAIEPPQSWEPLDAALAALEGVDDEHVRHLINFIRGSRRGFTREEREAPHPSERELLFKVRG